MAHIKMVKPLSPTHQSSRLHRLTEGCLLLALTTALVVPTVNAVSPAPVEPKVQPDGTVYPRVLTGADITRHFSSSTRMHANATSRPFTLTISRRDAERNCPTCRLKEDYGRIRIKEDKNLVCIDWNKATYPESGCFSLIQTSDSTFDLRTSAGKTIMAYTVVASAPTAGSSEQAPQSKLTPPIPAQGTTLSRTIIFRIPKPDTDTQRLITAGQQALHLREWNLESCDKNCLRGSLEKSGVRHWVEIRVQAPYVEIGFITGTQEGKPGWLENLKKDMLTVLSRS
jgi:hypothetical protein